MIDFKSFKTFAFFILSLAFLSCEEVIFTEDISEETIRVLAPKDSSEVLSTEVNFNWEALEGSTSYKIQVVTPSFEEASQIVLDSITSNVSFFSNLSPGNYEWRVKGFNNSYETLFSTQSFTVVEEEE